MNESTQEVKSLTLLQLLMGCFWESNYCEYLSKHINGRIFGTSESPPQPANIKSEEQSLRWVIVTISERLQNVCIFLKKLAKEMTDESLVQEAPKTETGEHDTR